MVLEREVATLRARALGRYRISCMEASTFWRVSSPTPLGLLLITRETVDLDTLQICAISAMLYFRFGSTKSSPYPLTGSALHLRQRANILLKTYFASIQKAFFFCLS